MPVSNLAILVKMSGGLLPPNSRAGDVEIYDSGRMLIFESDTDIVERQIDRQKVLEILQYARESGFFQLPNIIHDSGASPNVPDVTLSIVDAMGNNTVTMTSYQRLKGEMRKAPFDLVYKRITDLAWESYTNGTAPAQEAPAAQPSAQQMVQPPPQTPVQQPPAQAQIPPLPFGGSNSGSQPNPTFDLPSLDDLLKSSGLQFDAPSDAQNNKQPGLPPLTPMPPVQQMSAQSAPSLPPLNQPGPGPGQNRQPPQIPSLDSVFKQPAPQPPQAPQPQQPAQQQRQPQVPQQQPKAPKQQPASAPQPQQRQPAPQQKMEQPTPAVPPAPKAPKVQVQQQQPRQPQPQQQQPAQQPEQSKRQEPPKQAEPPKAKQEQRPPAQPPQQQADVPAPRQDEPRPPKEQTMERNPQAQKPIQQEPPRQEKESRPAQERDDRRPMPKQPSQPAMPPQRKPPVAWERTQESIERLEESLHSKVLVFYAADARLGMEDMRYLYSHLRKLGRKKSLYVIPFIQDTDSTVVWRMATLIREFCEELTVILPEESSMPTTMFALAADSILMNPFGFLSPIDTSFSHSLLQKTFDSQSSTVPISEIFQAASMPMTLKNSKQKDDAASGSDPSQGPFHPLVTAAAARQFALTQRICANLLKLSSKNKRSDAEISRIVTQLTQGYPSAHYPIVYFEAQTLGLPVGETNEAVNDVLWDLVKEYVYITQPVIHYQNDNKLFEKQNIIIESTGRRTIHYSEQMTAGEKLVEEHTRWRELTQQISINSAGKEAHQLLWKELQLVGSNEN